MILVDHGVKVIEGFCRNVITVTARHALDLKRVLRLSAGQCPAHNGARNSQYFLTDNFAIYRLAFKVLLRQTQQ